MEVLHTWHKGPLGLEDKLIGFWWSDVKGHSNLAEHIFGPKLKMSYTNYEKMTQPKVNFAVTS